MSNPLFGVPILSSIKGVTFISLGCLRFISWSFLHLRCFDVVCCHLQFWDFLLKYNNINLSMENFHYDKLHQKLFNINIRKNFLKLKIDQLICYFKLHTAEGFTNWCRRSFKKGVNFEVLNYTDELMFYCPNRFTLHLFSRAFFIALVGPCLHSLESMVSKTVKYHYGYWNTLQGRFSLSFMIFRISFKEFLFKEAMFKQEWWSFISIVKITLA